MTRIPRSALILGLAGLIPFIFGAASTLGWVSFYQPVNGIMLTAGYAMLIIVFMSGALWGFATKTDGARATAAFTLSVLPALFAYFFPTGNVGESVIIKIAAFIGLLIIHFQFTKWDLAPAWWMRLSLPLTVIAILSLSTLLI